MSELVTDCPRCGAKSITFDVFSDIAFQVHYDWQYWFEAFSVCRACHRSTTFIVSQKELDRSEFLKKKGVSSISGSANDHVAVEYYLSLKDNSSSKPPEHLPEDIEAAFREASTCLAVGCYNASAAMFRLCIDLTTKPLLPEEDEDGLTKQKRRNLGLRLPWLFENNRLPRGLEELSSCIKEDGNDGAHDGSLQKEDAEDLLDFTYELLERIFTEPKRLDLAKERRALRRTKNS